MKEILLNYLAEHPNRSEDYVLSKFIEHDIVLLGEMHYVKQQLELYHRLIPKLGEKGIRILAYEFARREDQTLLDDLLGKSFFDESLAKTIMIKQESLFGYREYMDVFKLVWQANQKLSQERKIRIIGLSDSINWPLYNQICNTTGRKPNPEEIREIWKGCNELHWKEVIDAQYAAGHTKILAITGSHHAFTHYREPDSKLVDGRKSFNGFRIVRFGNYLHEAYSRKVFNICFHDPWESQIVVEGSIAPAKGIIEQSLYPRYHEIGFDLIGSPFGELPDDSIYALGYQDFRLKDIFNGMIYTGRLQDLKHVTPIKDFIDESNIDLFRNYNAYNDEAGLSIAQINALICEDIDLI